MSKTIVICSDGTGNADTGVPSNVKRLYDMVVQDGPRQLAVYDKGVGTELRKPGENVVGYWCGHVRSLCFGEGVAENLLELYTWLVEHYEPGDRVFLFGFSRGAFTVRALAGLIHVCGLLQSDKISQAQDAVRLYEGSEDRIVHERCRLGLPPKFGPKESDHGSMDVMAQDFKARNCRPCVVDFLGLWDTVKAYGWLRPRSFPALRHNPVVRVVRHAASLDERRALFKVTGWGDRHQEVKEVWFAGDHSDVGGGHKNGNSPLADASLRWMLGEATQQGLELNPETECEVKQVAARSAEAPRAAPKSLWIRRGFIALDCLPRVELENSEYPPERLKRVFWIDGARKPGDHAFADTVTVHHSVDARVRAGEKRYSTGRLIRRSKANGPTTIQVAVAQDLEICWNNNILNPQ